MNLQQLLDSPSIRFKTKDILRIVDDMDVVDALKDIELIRAYLMMKAGIKG